MIPILENRLYNAVVVQGHSEDIIQFEQNRFETTRKGGPGMPTILKVSTGDDPTPNTIMKIRVAMMLFWNSLDV
jgi:hypothetical protein